MILKNLTVRYHSVVLVLLLLLTTVTASTAQDTPFENLKHKFESGEIFNSRFEHQSIDSYTEDTVSNKGTIWVGERKYKVRTSNQTVVVDGQTSMVYDDNRNRVIISKYEPAEDDFAPSRILNGIDSTYTVQEQEKRENGIYILLTSDDPFAIYKEVEIYLTTGLVPRRIRAVDPADNILTTTFNGGEFVSSDDKMFLLDYPDGAEIIDMRNK